MNKNIFLTVVFAVGAIGFGACSSASTNTVSSGNTGNKNIANNTAVVNQPATNAPVENVGVKTANTTADLKPPAKSVETLTADTSKNEKIGVAECDEYIEKYEACVNNKVPEAERAALTSQTSQLEIYRKGWKKAVTNQQAKAMLPGSCKVALETAKQSLSKFSCDW